MTNPPALERLSFAERKGLVRLLAQLAIDAALKEIADEAPRDDDGERNVPAAIEASR